MEIYLLVSDSVLLEIVKTVGIITTAILSTIAVIIGRKARKEGKDLSVKVDGRLSDLLAETQKRYEAEGREAGVAQQKAESKVDIASAPPIELKVGKLEVELKSPIKPE